MSLLSLDIARRYLYGKKSTNSINIITGISVFGISIGTAALILILSVFNGFESLLSGLFNAFNPDLKVTSYEGKFFELDEDTYNQLTQINGINSLSKTIEEVSLFEYDESKEIGIIKGVDEHYIRVTQLDSMLIYGQFKLRENNVNYSVIGLGMKNKLSVNIKDALRPITVYMPMKKKKIIGAKEFVAKDVYPSGVFSVRSETDYQYIITHIDFVRKLVEQPGKISALEIKLHNDAKMNQVKSDIQFILGNKFLVKDRYEQDAAYLKIMEIEKWFSFLIAGLTMFLIAFNLIGALWMIVLDKQKDISVFISMGFYPGQIRKIFMNLGILITSIGLIIGFLMAFGAYFLQKNYGIIGIPDGFLVDAYPVRLKLWDFLIVTLTVLTIGYLAALLPANRASKTELFLKSQH